MSAIETAVRNPAKVHADLIKQGVASLTKGGCYIYIPVGYTSKELAFISSTVEIIGMFAISTDRKTYGVSNVTTLIEITPSSFEEIMVQGEPYYEFRFDPGTVVFPNRQLQVISNHVYNIASYQFDFGNRPFWMNAVDDAETLSNTQKWNGFRVFADQITADCYAAHTQRTLGDPRQFFRYSLKKDSDLYKPVQFIPLRDGSLNKTSRLAKLADVELRRGIMSALSVDPVRAEPLEDLFMR
jgi:hypothetical protein